MRFNENWDCFFQKSVHSSQNIILATFIKKKLFRTKNYLKKIMVDFRKFIKSIPGGKKIFRRSRAAPLTNFKNLPRAIIKMESRDIFGENARCYWVCLSKFWA
jgi:hypothetical protein